MSADHPAPQSSSEDAAKSQDSSGNPTPVVEVCAGCHLPLTRRGSQGECLRCAVGLALMGTNSAEDPADPGDRIPTFDDDPSPNEGPKRYGHFEVAVGFDGQPRELGRGAMATTYRALDTTLRLPVALKVISQNVAGHPDARARFLREARAAARLHHPNVAAVTFYGEERGECFYAMELVEGETLAERVQRAGTFTPAQAMEVGIQVARALAAAEAVGVVHRDLKPSNLMLVAASAPASAIGTAAGQAAPLHVKVIDWGLAKAVSTDDALLGADHTRGGFVGTPAFASPEQFARGLDQRIDVRIDIYSLGVTLWFLLCGKVPFVGDTLDAIHARQKALPVEQLKAAKVPRALGELLRSMAAFDPARRPQSARELLDKLRDCQESHAAETPTTTRRRRYRRFAGALTLCVLLAAGAGTWWRHTQQAKQAMASEKPVLAVLPFENLSSDPADAFFTTGTQDEITNDLAHVAALNVLSADSTRSYLPGHRDLASIARETGARYLLEGGVNRQEGQVAINVRVVDARDPAHPWAERFTRRLNEVFAVQGEITRAVAAHLRATLSDAEKAAIDRPPTTNLTAYDLYLRAKDDEQTFPSAEDRYRYALDTTVPLLEHAVQLDPQFAFAYAELAKTHDALVPYETDKGQAELAQRHRAAGGAAMARATRLRPDAGEIHLAQAQSFYELDQNYEQATQELALARQTLPNSAALEGLAGTMARAQNHWEEAVQSLKRAVVLAPRNNEQRFYLANTYRYLRRFDEADHETAQIIAALPPGSALAFRMYRAIGKLEERADLTPLQEVVEAAGPANPAQALVMLKARWVIAFYSHDAARATALLGDIPSAGLVWGSNRFPKAWFEALAARLRRDEAAARDAFGRARIEEDRVLLTDPTSGFVLSVLAMIDAGLGHQDEAVSEALHACELAPVEKLALDAPIVACHLAIVYAWTNQPERACQALEPWLNRPAGDSLVKQPMYGDFRLNPVWDSLQGDLRFEKLVGRLAPETKPLTPVQPGPKP